MSDEVLDRVRQGNCPKCNSPHSQIHQDSMYHSDDRMEEYWACDECGCDYSVIYRIVSAEVIT